MTITLKSGATFSDCRKYRYALWRIWDDRAPKVMFIGLNPSTADEKTDDGTIRQCIGFAKRWGFGGVYMLNIFAFKATHPENLKKSADPIGDENDMYLTRYAEKSSLIIGAWGNHGVYLNRGAAVIEMFPAMQCLKMTKMNQPSHPLYLRADTDHQPVNSDSIRCE
ncbi:MAG: DUF1643 domain-containing protein [FCB group bacterium]|nr:DUF1643 domain-containing protein [FCB group bacterium]